MDTEVGHEERKDDGKGIQWGVEGDQLKALNETGWNFMQASVTA